MPEDGSPTLVALEHFAEITGHPEITTIPWCLWGHSGRLFREYGLPLS